MIRIAALLLAILLAGIVLAEAPLSSLRPTARNVADTPEQTRPILRPQNTQEPLQVVAGPICGNPAIMGVPLGIVEGAGACGIVDAVRVQSVSGVALSPAAVVECGTATALNQWVVDGAQPAAHNRIASLRVVSSYACRSRNSQSGARLSEHANGRAIDIAGIILRDGREITILDGWGSFRDGAKLRKMWQAACGVFGTVLGPASDRFHRDHFHFDTAQYRSGPYCR